MIGLVLTYASAILGLGLGHVVLADGLVVVLLLFALLESVLAFCAGCWVFGRLMRAGLISPETCKECAAIWTGTAVRPGEDVATTPQRVSSFMGM